MLCHGQESGVSLGDPKEPRKVPVPNTCQAPLGHPLGSPGEGRTLLPSYLLWLQKGQNPPSLGARHII